MPLKDILAAGEALAAILVPIFGLLYLVIRLAVRSEILALETRIRDRYVTVEACQNIRRDCPARRLAIREPESK